MTDFSFVLLYVEDPARSAKFYTELLGCEPVESSPTFAMFPLGSGIMLGLWKQQDVKPDVIVPNGGGEIAFIAKDTDAVKASYVSWRSRGWVMAQEPTAMDFGHTFVALDPDGNRIRVFAPKS